MKANLLLAVLLMGCTVPPIPKPLDEAVSKLASTADRNKVQRIKLNESYLDYVIDRRLSDGADDDGKVSLDFVRAMLEISKRGHGLIREIDAADHRQREKRGRDHRGVPGRSGEGDGRRARRHGRDQARRRRRDRRLRRARDREARGGRSEARGGGERG